MTTYLHRVGSTYRFRRVVPLDLRPYFLTASGAQRVEFNESLRTKDRREAERRCRERAVETDRLLEHARRLAGQPQPTMQAMTEGELWAMEAASAANAEAHREWERREASRQKLIEIAAGGSDNAAKALRDLLDDQHFESSAERTQRQGRTQQAWAEGEAEYLEQWANTRSIAVEPAYPTLMGLFDAYLEAAQIEAATVKRWRPVIAHLIKFIGHDDASKLTTENVRAWKEALLKECDGGKPARAPKTVRETYLAALKTVLNEAVQSGRLSENVALNVKVRVPRQVRLREPSFSSEEVKTILRGTLASRPDRLTEKHALARRWVPWLCAYTGARVNEITQLRAEDVQEIDGIWAIRITPDAGGVKTKEARLVPLHSHLIEQGFLKVAESQKVGPLFYEPKAGRGGSAANPHYKKVGERLAQWVRALGVTDPNVQPNHAWRHLFTSNARLANLDPEAREAIPGHAPATTGRAYGGAKPMAFLAREIEKLPRFEI